MSEQKISYVKPLLTHLAFTADTAVSMQQTCKTSGSSSGPAISDCLAVGGGSVCAAPTS